MSFPVSALSPAPFSQQLQRQNCSVQLWPDFKPAPTQSSSNHRPRQDAQKDAPSTALDHAFEVALHALSGGPTTRPELPSNFIPPLNFDRTDHANLPSCGTTIESPPKRSAETADLIDIPENTKKPKTVFVDYHDTPTKRRPGRPSKAATTAPKPKKVLKTFRANMPVKTGIPDDIWCTIIENGHLQVAFTMKDVAKRFRGLLLDRSAMWKTARLNTFGHDQPDPPPGLSEWQYADLLVGIGCQSKGCKDKKTRKVYWAFQRRWCNTCLKRNVIMESSCRPVIKNYPNITSCVPSVSFDQYMIYQCIGEYEPGSVPSWLRIDPWSKKAYLRADFAKVSLEFQEFERTLDSYRPEVSEIRTAWVNDKKKANEELVRKLQSIENWAESYRREKEKGEQDPAASTTESGASTAQAGVQGEEMQRYAPTIVSGEPREESPGRHPSDYEHLAHARQERRCFETDSVLVLAHQVVGDMDDVFEPMMEGNFVRIVLMETYQKFQEYTGVESRNRLLMDDARLVYQEVLKPILDCRPRHSHHRRHGATGTVRCPGCKRGRGNKALYSFPALMIHIFENHTNDSTGDFEYFNVSRTELPSDVKFPWCYIEWPRNLPILAVGQDTGGRWDVHAEGERYPRPSYCVDPSPKGPGAFDDRIAAVSNGSGPLEFVENVLFAASQLGDSSIGDTFKTQIALEYAVQRYTSAGHGRPGFGLVEELQLGLIRNGVKGLFEGFRCQQCCEAIVREGRTGYFARSVKPLGQLVEHFEKSHPQTGDWTRHMFNLHTAQDLLVELQLPGNESTYVIFQRLFPAE
ncbi:MAG: hypothetical protein Q9223_001288, partial [Gallowayella weberi]